MRPPPGKPRVLFIVCIICTVLFTSLGIIGQTTLPFLLGIASANNVLYLLSRWRRADEYQSTNMNAKTPIMIVVLVVLPSLLSLSALALAHPDISLAILGSITFMILVVQFYEWLASWRRANPSSM
jgi:hypothetical protein